MLKGSAFQPTRRDGALRILRQVSSAGSETARFLQELGGQGFAKWLITPPLVPFIRGSAGRHEVNRLRARPRTAATPPRAGMSGRSAPGTGTGLPGMKTVTSPFPAGLAVQRRALIAMRAPLEQHKRRATEHGLLPTRPQSPPCPWAPHPQLGIGGCGGRLDPDLHRCT